MRLLKIHLTRTDAAVNDDDVISFHTVSENPDFIKVTVEYAATGTAEKSGFSNSFMFSRGSAYDYTMTVVGSLIRDDDPFEYVQLNSSMFPSVIYRVEHLEDPDVRSAIQDIVWSSLNTTVQ
jgi:hypothetical protein